MKKFLALLLAAAMVVSLAACGSSGGSGGGGAADSGSAGDDAAVVVDTPSEDDYVVRTFGTTQIGSFMVGGAVSANEGAMHAIFDSLWLLDENGELYSNVLEDWHYEDDGLTFYATIKPGVIFANGEEATSEDVLYSITTYLERASIMADSYGSLDWENCYTVDEYTAAFVFTEPWAPTICTAASYLYDKSWCEEVGWDNTDAWMAPMGSGPYEVANYVPDSNFELVLRDDYWDDSRTFLVDEWDFVQYNDPSTMAVEYEQGLIDFVYGLNITDFDRYLAGGVDGVATFTKEMNDVVFFTFPYETQPIFEDVNIRQAICEGVDWSAISNMAYGSLAVQATSTLPSTSPYYLDVGAYEYNPEHAAQLVAESGYSAEDLTFVINTFQGTMYEDVCSGIQYYLGEIGITVDYKLQAPAQAIVSLITPGGTDFNIQSTPTGNPTGDPLRCWMQLTSTGAFVSSHLCDDYFYQQYELGLHEMDHDARVAIYQDLQQYLHDNYMICPICEYYACYAYNPSVFTPEQISAACVSGMVIDILELS